MIINVFLLHNKQHRTRSFLESGRQANHICTVGELCICCFCNQPTNPSRFLRPDYCCWQLISLLHSRAGSRGEKLGLLKSVTKSCSFSLSQGFSLNLFISEWTELKILYFLSALSEAACVMFCSCLCRRCARCRSPAVLPCPECPVLGRQEQDRSVCAPSQGTWHSSLNSVPGVHPVRSETPLNNTP